MHHLANRRQVLLSKAALVLLLMASKRMSGTPIMCGGNDSRVCNSTHARMHTHTRKGSESRALNSGTQCNTTWQECR